MVAGCTGKVDNMAEVDSSLAVDRQVGRVGQEEAENKETAVVVVVVVKAEVPVVSPMVMLCRSCCRTFPWR